MFRRTLLPLALLSQISCATYLGPAHSVNELQGYGRAIGIDSQDFDIRFDGRKVFLEHDNPRSIRLLAVYSDGEPRRGWREHRKRSSRVMEIQPFVARDVFSVFILPSFLLDVDCLDIVVKDAQGNQSFPIRYDAGSRYGFHRIDNSVPLVSCSGHNFR